MFWRKGRRREQIRNQPFPPQWHDLLVQKLAYYRALPPEDQRELQGHINVLLGEKNFEGCGGLALNDEMKLIIAAQAALLLLHRETDYYPNLVSILVYPSAFVVERCVDEGPLELEGEEVLSGEAWQRGVVILAWDDVRRGMRNSRDASNLIIHEFAHQLDMENGSPDGYPALEDAELQQRWPEVFQREYAQLVDDLDHDRRTLIDPYGEEDPSEFFSVVTELFFGRPKAMQRRHPELYDVMRLFFRQDPALVLARRHEHNEYTSEGSDE